MQNVSLMYTLAGFFQLFFALLLVYRTINVFIVKKYNADRFRNEFWMELDIKFISVLVVRY